MQDLYRIIDANLNRSREGLRVIEDIARFHINNVGVCRRLKQLRHELTDTVKDTKALISSRNSQKDIGKRFNLSLEGGGKKLKGLVTANFRRVEEALRVLEEVYKVLKPSKVKIFKKLRFRTYNLEKKVYERL